MVQFYRHICADDQAQDIAKMLAVILVKGSYRADRAGLCLQRAAGVRPDDHGSVINPAAISTIAQCLFPVSTDTATRSDMRALSRIVRTGAVKQ
jgi:hypothetical protein